MTTFRTALAAGRKALEGRGVEGAALDARLLLSAAAGLDMSALIARDGEVLPGLAEAAYNSHLRRRLQGEPVARILGEKEFWGLPFQVSEAVLVPRPDTETLVEAVLAEAKRRDLPPRLAICDLGTGSGAIIVALMREFSEARGVATDISAAALGMARRNAEGLGVAGRISFVESGFADGAAQKFDVVVSNPPYIASGDIADLQPEVRDYDPRLALDGGPDGLAAYRAILSKAQELLGDGGFLALEIGAGRSGVVGDLCREAGFQNITSKRDLAGIERVVIVARQAAAGAFPASKKHLENSG